MIAYADATILLRVILELGDPLPELTSVDRPITSAISEVECLRVIDRLRLEGDLDDESVSAARAFAYRVLDSFQTVQITEAIVTRAAQPTPTVLGTAGSIHLATALLWREAIREEPVVATHDRYLALAARSFGFQVVGA